MYLTHNGTSGTKRASEGLITCSRTCNNRLCSIYPWRSNIGKAAEAREQVCVRVACSGEISGPRCCCRSRLAGRSSGAHFRTAPVRSPFQPGRGISCSHIQLADVHTSYTRRNEEYILAPSRVSPAR